MPIENAEQKIALKLDLAMEAGNIAWWEMIHPTGKVYFNDNKAKMIGRDPKDFKHYMDFVNIVHPEDQPKIMQAMRDHLSGAKPLYETEYRIQNNEGKYLWFYDRGRIVDKSSDGKTTVMGIVINITEQKEALAKVQKDAKDLETMNKFMVGRELEMVELKKEIERLKKRLGEE